MVSPSSLTLAPGGSVCTWRVAVGFGAGGGGGAAAATTGLAAGRAGSGAPPGAAERVSSHALAAQPARSVAATAPVAPRLLGAGGSGPPLGTATSGGTSRA